MASALLRLVARVLPLDDTLLFALDDTPTKRAGGFNSDGAGIRASNARERAGTSSLTDHGTTGSDFFR
jgi:hypothetical protein